MTLVDVIPRNVTASLDDVTGYSFLSSHTLSSVTEDEQDLEEESCSRSLFFFIVYGPVYAIICAVGLIGNSLSFAILHRSSRESVATYLLKALAVVDNVFLAISGFVQIFTGMTVYYGHSHLLEPYFPYLQASVWPTVHTVQLGTVWMMVLVAANRYVAVCRPLHAARLCSKRNVTRQMALTFICVILYNVPRFAEYRYVYVNDVPSGSDDDVTVTSVKAVTEKVNVGLASIQLYNILYENIAYCLFVYLIPLSILIVLNGHLVRELKRAQKCRQTLIGRSNAEENNITLVMVVIIISFIVCETPASINQVLYYIYKEDGILCSAYQRYSDISNLLITTNSSLNFFIYCLFRRQFQQELRAMLCRGASPNRGGVPGRGGGGGVRALKRHGSIILRGAQRAVSARSSSAISCEDERGELRGERGSRVSRGEGVGCGDCLSGVKMGGGRCVEDELGDDLTTASTTTTTTTMAMTTTMTLECDR